MNLQLLFTARRWVLALYLGAALTGTGCQDSMPRKEDDGFRDEFADWGSKQRPAGEEGEQAGASSKSRQIERNLGIR